MPSRPSDGSIRKSRSQFDKSGRTEILIESECPQHAKFTHQGKTRCIDERVFAFIVLSQPPQRGALMHGLDRQHIDPGGALDTIQIRDRGRVPAATPEKRPGLATNMVGRDQLGPLMGLEQKFRLFMMKIATIPESDPERRVDEDQRYTVSSMSAGG